MNASDQNDDSYYERVQRRYEELGYANPGLPLNLLYDEAAKQIRAEIRSKEELAKTSF
jgi:hypothetical protein